MHAMRFVVLLSALAITPVLAAGGGRVEIAFPGIASVPTPPNVSYGGYFKSHHPVRIVFGVSDPGGPLKESLTNAAYTIEYLKPRRMRYEIEFVLYGKAVRAASQFGQAYSGYATLMEALHKRGVAFRVCNNSLPAMDVHPGDLYPYMKLVPGGILQIVKKQMQGYAYISNK